jgi:predicted nucleic acid-binding protein
VLLLDTSFLVDYETEVSARRVGAARSLMRSRPLETLGVSVVSLGEFAEGFSNPRDVEEFLRPFRIIGLSQNIAYRAAAMQVNLSQRLGENDAWIAATALVYGATLVGRERAFARVPRLDYLAI